MPRARRRPVQPIAPVAPDPQPEPEPITVDTTPDLPIKYPKIQIDEFSTTSEKGPLDIAWCKQALGWITEEEWQAYQVKHMGGTPSQYLFGDNYHCKNLKGEKVRCEYNANNRPFDENWCKDLTHTILSGQWAGPHTLPGETVNGETIRISKYGRTLSGQHQMTALILAGEQLALDRKMGVDTFESPKYPAWVGEDEPFIETIVVRGLSEDPRVLMTVDYVKPRTSADVFYTSEVFKGSTSQQRKELCRLLATATDLLWTRTDAKGYRTHPELVGFLERHRRLLDCVNHIYNENRAPNRGISKLRLSPGHCAALCYLMAASGTEEGDSDVYRNMEPPSEKGINFDYWDKAQEFFVYLCGSVDFEPVRVALGHLLDSTPVHETNIGLGGLQREKFALLARAWEHFRDLPDSAGQVFSQEDLAEDGILCLTYSDHEAPKILNEETVPGKELPHGKVRLVDVADFGGIDVPESLGRGPTAVEEPMPTMTEAEIEAATQEALRRRTQKGKK